MPKRVKLRRSTVAALPSAVYWPGEIRVVTDATAVLRGTVAGGGANIVVVFSDGTNWVIVA